MSYAFRTPRVSGAGPLLFGLCVGGLCGPLLIAAAENLSSAPPPVRTATFGVAQAIVVHPNVAFALATVLSGAIFWVAGRDSKELSLLWGALRTTLPENTLEAQQALVRAERLRELAEDIITDFAGLAALITTLVDSTRREAYIDVLNRLCEAASRAIATGPAITSSVWLYDPASTTLSIIASYRVGHQTSQFLKLTPGTGLAGQVFSTKQIRIVPDVTTVDPSEFSPDPNSLKPAHSSMGLPIYDDSRAQAPVGAFCFSHANLKNDHQFSRTTATSARAFALLVNQVLALARVKGVSLQ